MIQPTRWSACLEVVDDSVVMVLKGVDYLAESVVAEGFHFVVPSGQVQPRLPGLGVLVEDVHKFEVYFVCPSKLWVHGEKYGGPRFLLLVPFGLVRVSVFSYLTTSKLSISTSGRMARSNFTISSRY